ncbi:fused response regulator/phosphatase [Pseudonocardiaceae bacterium YIM PH 21723]|nr:fused response regulator/phosphatase [Pseudonocardiaceae bacterium YIM PH 21723]
MQAGRYLTASWLRRNGHQVFEAATGAEGLAALRQNEIDVVMLDVHLPDMSGYEVCERIKADPHTEAVPVIHTSAVAIDAHDRTQGLTRGADGYLTEPINPDELIATVEAVLRYYRARQATQQLANRLALLTEATMAINTASTFDDLLAAAAEGASRVLGGSATALALTSRGRVRAATVEEPGEPVVRHTLPRQLFERLTTQVLGDESHVIVPAIPELGWRRHSPSTVVVVQGRTSRPATCIAVESDRVVSDDDRGLLLQLGQATALACEGLLAFAQEHQLAITLQRSLLPRSLPKLPALEIAARYVPASTHAEIGGDFYEVTELGDRLLIAVGDVTGHSIDAATVMGEIRHALRAYAVEGHDLVGILERLDTLILRFHPQWLTTASLVLLNPETGEMQVANAGHLPMLLTDAEGSRYLEIRGPLLGVGLRRPPVTRLELPVGTTCLLITDGLVERRGEDLDTGLERLRSRVQLSPEPDALCDQLLEDLGGDTEDDVALLAFRRT